MQFICCLIVKDTPMDGKTRNDAKCAPEDETSMIYHSFKCTNLFES